MVKQSHSCTHFLISLCVTMAKWLKLPKCIMSAVQCIMSAVQCRMSAVQDDGCRQVNEAVVVEIEMMGYIREKADEDSKHTAS